jgi:signal peptidase II
MKLRGLGVFAVTAVAVLALDQGSKAWARTLPVGVPRPVIAGFWDWELASNDGIAFSLLRGGSAMQLVLAGIALAAAIAVGVAAARTPKDLWLRKIGYGLIAGGALGNLIDRVVQGGVTDFVRWHVHAHMWPIFNVADAALLMGVAVLVASGFFERRSAARRTVEV